MSRWGSRSTRSHAGAAAVTLGAMVMTPLWPRGGAARRRLAGVVVSGIGTTTALATTRRWGPARAATAAVATVLTTGGVERLGTRTGVPFGRYHYTGALRPRVAGVPAIVPLAWFAMAVPAREAAAAALGRPASPAARIVGGAVALTAWDLFLDPQMVGEGYWRWHDRGRYRGIPLSNFAGWFVTGLGVMTLLEVVLPPRRGAAADLVAEYATMGVMETLGFATWFRDRTVAAIGGAAMLPTAGAAVARLLVDRSRGGRP